MNDAFDVLDRHLESVRAGTTDQHVEQVRTSVSHFLRYMFDELGHASIRDVEWEDLERYYERLEGEYVARTSHNRWTHVRDYLETAVDEFGGENPAVRAEEESNDIDTEELVKVPKKIRAGGQSIVHLDGETIDAVVDACDSVRDKLAVRLLQDTGLRASELCSVRVDDLEREENAITRVLTAKREDGHERTVWYRPSTAVLMRRYLDEGGRSQFPPHEESPYLLVSIRSESIHPNWLNRIVVEAAQEAGVQETVFTDAKGHNRYRVTCHNLRHTFAIERVQNGMPIEYLRRLLGHKDMETTKKYLRFRESDVKEAELRYRP